MPAYRATDGPDVSEHVHKVDKNQQCLNPLGIIDLPRPDNEPRLTGLIDGVVDCRKQSEGALVLSPTIL